MFEQRKEILKVNHIDPQSAIQRRLFPAANPVHQERSPDSKEQQINLQSLEDLESISSALVDLPVIQSISVTKGTLNNSAIHHHQNYHSIDAGEKASRKAETTRRTLL